MSFVGLLFKIISGSGDKKRDRDLKIPEDLILHHDLSFSGKQEKYEMLDVYYPKGTSRPLPVILNVHGGGWVYGTKDVYLQYCLFLAQQGFAVVNMNYHLAPKKRFPTQLAQINQVIRWMRCHAQEYFLDMNSLFLVGDSAGAQMVSQYAAIATNPDYAKLFPFAVPDGLKISAVGLNGGTYEIGPVPKGVKKKFHLPKNIEDGSKLLQSEDAMMGLMAGLMKDYLGQNGERFVPMLDVKGNITEAFPPAYVMTSYYDFVKEQAEPMWKLLRSQGVDAEYKCYGTEADTHLTHVCHTNMNFAEAKQMNMDELAFFRAHIV